MTMYFSTLTSKRKLGFVFLSILGSLTCSYPLLAMDDKPMEEENQKRARSVNFDVPNGPLPKKPKLVQSSSQPSTQTTEQPPSAKLASPHEPSIECPTNITPDEWERIKKRTKGEWRLNGLKRSLPLEVSLLDHHWKLQTEKQQGFLKGLQNLCPEVEKIVRMNEQIEIENKNLRENYHQLFEKLPALMDGSLVKKLNNQLHAEDQSVRRLQEENQNLGAQGDQLMLKHQSGASFYQKFYTKYPALFANNNNGVYTPAPAPQKELISQEQAVATSPLPIPRKAQGEKIFQKLEREKKKWVETYKVLKQEEQKNKTLVAENKKLTEDYEELSKKFYSSEDGVMVTCLENYINNKIQRKNKLTNQRKQIEEKNSKIILEINWFASFFQAFKIQYPALYLATIRDII